MYQRKTKSGVYIAEGGEVPWADLSSHNLSISKLCGAPYHPVLRLEIWGRLSEESISYWGKLRDVVERIAKLLSWIALHRCLRSIERFRSKLHWKNGFFEVLAMKMSYIELFSFAVLSLFLFCAVESTYAQNLEFTKNDVPFLDSLVTLDVFVGELTTPENDETESEWIIRDFPQFEVIKRCRLNDDGSEFCISITRWKGSNRVIVNISGLPQLEVICHRDGTCVVQSLSVEICKLHEGGDGQVVFECDINILGIIELQGTARLWLDEEGRLCGEDTNGTVKCLTPDQWAENIPLEVENLLKDFFPWLPIPKRVECAKENPCSDVFDGGTSRQ